MNIQTRVQNLEEQIQALIRVTGLAIEEWVSPEKASPHVGLSRNAIADRINDAETARVTSQQYPMKYGTHYRQIPSSRNWQVNWKAMNELLNNTPPEQWPDVERGE